MAAPCDANEAVPLIYSSGPDAIDYGFSRQNQTGKEFLSFAFVNGYGFLGYRNHTVATIGEQVVGIVASYNLPIHTRLALEHLVQLWRFYRVPDLQDLIVRAYHLKSTMPPPARGVHYIANFGVATHLQNMGIGSRILEQQKTIARSLGRVVLALDVSVKNLRAQTLYERCGMVVVRQNRFTGRSNIVHDTRRMEIPL